MISTFHTSGKSLDRHIATLHVAREIDQVLSRSPYRELHKLNVTCEDRVARITGFVSSYFTKLIAAEEIQLVTPTGWRVYNKVVVCSPSQKTRS